MGQSERWDQALGGYAVVRGEGLPVPVRDVVIKLARFALKRVGTAQPAAEAAVKLPSRK